MRTLQQALAVVEGAQLAAALLWDRLWPAGAWPTVAECRTAIWLWLSQIAVFLVLILLSLRKKPAAFSDLLHTLEWMACPSLGFFWFLIAISWM